MNESVVETKNLYFTYPDGTHALEDINLSIKKGEIVGILGANGSGKTTLLKILNSLLKPAKGEVYLESKKYDSIDKNKLFGRICTCFQNPDDQLFSPTVNDDISFGPINMGLSKAEVSERVKMALESVEMSEFADKAIHNLSYGQKKRICLAGVLAMTPEVMLLDEITSCMDPAAVNSIMRLLKKLNKENGITMVMSTHSVDLVPLFIDRVIILNKGRIVSDGMPRDVFSRVDMIRDAQLRLPRIGHLFEILSKKDGFSFDGHPLTIGEARVEILKMNSECGVKKR